MKKTISISIIILMAACLQAQSLSPTVIAGTGGFSSGANGSLSYTVGEMTMVQTFSANGNILTQGFQQPNELGVGLLELAKDDYGSFIVYPNPAVDNTWFGFELPDAGSVVISLYDELGRKISDVYAGNYNNGKIVEQTNVSRLAGAMYYMTMTFTPANGGKTHISTRKLQIIR